MDTPSNPVWTLFRKPSRSSKQRVHRHHHRRYRQRSPHHTAGDPAHVPAPPRLHADGISTPVRLHHAHRAPSDPAQGRL